MEHLPTMYAQLEEDDGYEANEDEQCAKNWSISLTMANNTKITRYKLTSNE